MWRLLFFKELFSLYPFKGIDHIQFLDIFPNSLITSFLKSVIELKRGIFLPSPRNQYNNKACSLQVNYPFIETRKK